ncbi:threonine aldolase family protein [Algivirga pacifica]|uniref:Low specificity L-threonine aldolase n=1 Tax=Algivirga pacifica TaxID=1162670 RepID=A0ABP9DJ91_9BACT
MKGFASDNYSGCSPEIMLAIQQANEHHQPSYGADVFTQQAISIFKEHFGENAEVFFVMNGTGANVTALQAICRPYEAVISSHMAHLNTDECSAPEKLGGFKIKDVYTEDGKLTIEHIKPLLGGRGVHQAVARVITITQSTEIGTLYTQEEIRTLANFAHENGLYLHVDGARIANAAVSLGVSFKEMLVDTGVDVVSFGGTKNGMMMGEAIIFLNPALAENFGFIRKQSMQLLSKMRYVGAQFVAYFKNDLWKKNAAHANQMAQLLANRLREVPAVSITQKVEANGVFAILPREITPALQEVFPFYIWNEETNEARLMLSFDSTEEEVERFVDTINTLLLNR